MRRDTLSILVCPLCKSELELTVAREEADVIIEGKLKCTSCRENFPIEDGIPNMLPPDLRD